MKPVGWALSLQEEETWRQRDIRNEWIKKMWYIYTTECCSVIERNAFEWVLMRWVNLEPFFFHLFLLVAG